MVLQLWDCYVPGVGVFFFQKSLENFQPWNWKNLPTFQYFSHFFFHHFIFCWFSNPLIYGFYCCTFLLFNTNTNKKNDVVKMMNYCMFQTMMIWRMSEISINHFTIYIKMLYLYSVKIITMLRTPISVSLFLPYSTVLTLISCFYKILSVNACLRWDM